MNKLKILRKNIDKIDTKIISLLLKRNGLVKNIVIYKKNYNLPIVDKKRELEVLNNAFKSSKNKLPKTFIRDLFKIIIKHSRKLQK